MPVSCAYYILIPTHRYDTEKFVGNGIKASGVPREDIFLATKLWCNSYHPDDVEEALDASLKDLDTPYVDLYLMHYPCTFKRGQERFPKGDDGLMIMGETTYLDTWNSMEKLVKSGKTRTIGVSNFNRVEIQNLVDNSDTVSLSYHSCSQVSCWIVAYGLTDPSRPSNGSPPLPPTTQLQHLALQKRHPRNAI